MVNLLFSSGKFLVLRKGMVNLPAAIFSVVLVSLVSGSMFFGHNIYGSVMANISMVKVARQLAANETDRIRAVSYDDVSKEELSEIAGTGSFYREIILGKEYREDIGNTVMKHKPVTVNIYGLPDSLFPLVSVKTEKVSRWYKSGSFDKSDGGIYDETGEQHKGTIRKTGNGTGYVFLKKGAQVNGDVEIYDETNGDVYIYNSIGTPSGKTVIRHIGPSTSSGYIRLTESCSVSGTVTLENSSNGGMIIETVLKNGTYIKKSGNGTGYLKLVDGSVVSNTEIYNESGGAVLVKGTLSNGSVLWRSGNSDSLLTLNGCVDGKLSVEMDNSGKVVLNDKFADGTNIFYSSNTNKGLTLSGTNIRGSVKFVNNSLGLLSVAGLMSDGCELLSSGSGSGAVYINGIVEGKVKIQNDTSGFIRSYTTFHNGKTIKKIGGGTGYLEFANSLVNIEGDFTLDNDGSGSVRFWGRSNFATKLLEIPVAVDGAYIYSRGGNYGGFQFVGFCDILGRINLDFSKRPSTYTFWGKYDNRASNPLNKTILQDGYSYKF